REMRRKLMDVESSFMPDLLSARVTHERTGADDTYLNIKHRQDSDIPPIHEQTEEDIAENDAEDEHEEEQEEDDEVASITSAAVIQPSSPAAAAAERSSMRAEPVRRVSENDHDLSTAFTRLTLRSNASKDTDQRSSSRTLAQFSSSEHRTLPVARTRTLLLVRYLSFDQARRRPLAHLRQKLARHRKPSLGFIASAEETKLFLSEKP
ncbi:hypothetical protein KCU73_g17284, partial [Aureobasidium melanogenum]